LVAALILGGIVFDGTAYPAPQGAPVTIVDPDDSDIRAQVTPDGALQVTGDVSLGETAGVEITNTPVPVDVTGGVLAPVTRLEALGGILIDAGESHSTSFPTINATSVIIAKGSDELLVAFSSPVASEGFVPVRDDNGTDATLIYTFPNPIPINGVELTCQNESDLCFDFVTLAGF
jgi:hypothetical protein